MTSQSKLGKATGMREAFFVVVLVAVAVASSQANYGEMRKVHFRQKPICSLEAPTARMAAEADLSAANARSSSAAAALRSSLSAASKTISKANRDKNLKQLSWGLSIFLATGLAISSGLDGQDLDSLPNDVLFTQVDGH